MTEPPLEPNPPVKAGALAKVGLRQAVTDYLAAIDQADAEAKRAEGRPGTWSCAPTINMLTHQDVLRLVCGWPAKMHSGAAFRVNYWAELDHAELRAPAAIGAIEPPADVVDATLREVVSAFPQGGPGHERAIRLAITRGWQARHLHQDLDR